MEVFAAIVFFVLGTIALSVVVAGLRIFIEDREWEVLLVTGLLFAGAMGLLAIGIWILP